MPPLIDYELLSLFMSCDLRHAIIFMMYELSPPFFMLAMPLAYYFCRHAFSYYSMPLIRRLIFIIVAATAGAIATLAAAIISSCHDIARMMPLFICR